MYKNKLKPVIRMPGSKYRQITKIFNKFNLNNNDNFIFIDFFGGSLIVGSNIKHFFPKSKVIMNDYDKWYPFNIERVINNQKSYSGIGVFTKQAIMQFNIKIKNGYWNNLYNFSNILKSIQILNLEFHDFCNYLEKNNFLSNEKTYIYIDPPYYGKKYEKLYINKLDYNLFFKKMQEYLNTKAKILISINNNELVKQNFKNWNIEKINIYYSITNNHKKPKDSNELFISNF